MSFITDLIAKLFGGGDPFAGLDPDDIAMFWKIERALDQVDREELALSQVLSDLNVSSRGKLETAMGAYSQRHGHKPEFAAAATRVNLDFQMQRFHQSQA